jgi:formate dehydrogenase iron-sulfur subunit
MDRRNFLKLSGAGLGTALIWPGRALYAGPEQSGLAILYDTSLCVGCRACQMNCKNWNKLPAESTAPLNIYESPKNLSAHTWTLIQLRSAIPGREPQHRFWNKQCMHCTEAACVQVCPTGAMYKHKLGFTAYDEKKCNGCGYCTQACPFGVPHLQTTNILTGKAKAARCTFCQDRVPSGQKTACVEACPVAALVMGNRQDILQEGKKRIAALQEKGFKNANLYGELEAGGLHRLSVLVDEPAAYALVSGIQVPPLINFWQKIVHPIGKITLGATMVAIVAAWLIIRRNIKMEEVE